MNTKQNATPRPPDGKRATNPIHDEMLGVLRRGPSSLWYLASLSGISNDHAGSVLRRLARKGIVRKYRDGVQGHNAAPSMWEMVK